MPHPRFTEWPLFDVHGSTVLTDLPVCAVSPSLSDLALVPDVL
jgi:hypothetical protein